MTGAACGCSNTNQTTEVKWASLNQQLNPWECLKEPVMSLLMSTGELRCIIPALSALPTSLRTKKKDLYQSSAQETGSLLT